MKYISELVQNKLPASIEVFNQPQLLVFDVGARSMKNLPDFTSFRGYLHYKNRGNKFKLTMISPYYNSSRSYSSSLSSMAPGNHASETDIFLKSDNFRHWFKNWQHLRKNKLTASTFALAVGFWPGGRAKLWQEKLGTLEPFSGNLATCWSNKCEQDAIERYKLITGFTVAFPEFQIYQEKNSEDSWLAASPDGIYDTFYYDLPVHGILEIKCPYFGGDMSNAYPWKRIPLHYIPQAQGLMEILNRDCIDMYCWTTKGSSLFRIYRDAKYWDLLKTALSDFWWNHVQPAKEICNRQVITEPLIELRSLRPAPKHELFHEIIKGSKHIVDNSRLLTREINGELQN